MTTPKTCKHCGGTLMPENNIYGCEKSPSGRHETDGTLRLNGLCISVPPNPHARVYHTRVLLSERIMSNTMTAGDPRLDAFMGIPGVQWCCIDRYQVSIGKSPMFEWEEIDMGVTRLLDSFSGMEAAQ